MNAKRIAAITALLASATAALADDITIASEANATARTRAEVRAELAAARSGGTLPRGGEIQQARPEAPDVVGLSRVDVRSTLARPGNLQRLGYLPG